MTAVASSTTAMTAVASSSVAVNEITKSAMAMNIIAKLTVDATIIEFYKTVNTSVTIIKQLYNCLLNTTYFRASSTSAQDSVSSLNSYGTTKNSIIAVATGYYSSTLAHTNVLINKTLVSDGTILNVYQPKTVSSANVGAIAVPTATFTETGDAYAAVAVYIAI